ncbi:MAG: phospho-sugar mutase [Eubacteriales bacterium]|nr:phospho-sugar mutase [Eubacteriales bacterium]
MTNDSAYQRWLLMCRNEKILFEELKRLRNDPHATEDRFYTDLGFGTGGMRGLLGAGPNRINIFTIRRAAAGLAEHLISYSGAQRRSVVIAYDSRYDSDRFALDAALVLAGRGIQALLFDALRPVPVLSYAVRHLGADAGIAITASHNPPEYSGFKVYGSDGAQITPATAQAITGRIGKLQYTECVPMEQGEAERKGLLCLIGNADVDDDYIGMILDLMVRPEAVNAHGGNLRIVYTPLHGTGNVPVRRALKEAGFTRVTVVREQELPDPSFATVKSPNPEDPDALAMAVVKAREIEADIVMGTDPDCDRLGACVRDEKGEYVALNGNQIGCLLLHHLLEEKTKMNSLPQNAAVVKTIVTTDLARAICGDFGVTVFDTLTGFKYIGEMIGKFDQSGEYTFLFGFEESYGFLSSPHIRDKDAVNAAVLLAEAACLSQTAGSSLYERLQQIYRRYGYFHEETLTLDFPGKEGALHMRRLMDIMRRQPPGMCAGLPVIAIRDYLSGFRVEGESSTPLNCPASDVLFWEFEGGHWLCLRPSGTEPKIKVYVSCRDAGDMQKARKLGSDLLNQVVLLLKSL